MNIAEQIKSKFKKVNKAFYEKEESLSFLRVEVALTDLTEVTKISREINNFVDEMDKSEDEYYLDIYSSGTEQEIDKKEIQNNIGKNVLVNLNTNIKNMNSFEGEVLEVSENEFIIKWNAKGQFRKQIIELDNVKDINLSSKIKKGKK